MYALGAIVKQDNSLSFYIIPVTYTILKMFYMCLCWNAL